jgi:glycosyltransferase involved in cell wall biosynthesis
MSDHAGTGGPRIRLAYLTNIPAPYRAVMLRAWADENPDLALSVCYTDPDDQGRGWSVDAIGHGVAETRLPVAASIRKYGKLNRGLHRMVRDHDVIMIGGFEQASYLVVALWARLMGKPVVLLFDGFSPARFGNEPAPVLALKRLTARLCQGFFANGTVGERYLREQAGVAAGQAIYNQYLSHSDAPIRAARDALAGMSKPQIQARLGIDAAGRPVLLCCGYLIPRKRIDLVIEAIGQLAEGERPMLLIVGSGPEETALRDMAARLAVPTHFAGFRQGQELAEHYFAADGLVLASNDDPWGLVVNEAMSAGLPVLVSDACGAALDLVRDSENGFVFDWRSADSLAQAIGKLLASNLNQLGATSQAMVADWTPSQSARNLGLVVRDVLGSARKPCR